MNAAIKRMPWGMIAAKVAMAIPDGSFVNLGIGRPTLVADHLPPDREIILHTENGMLGVGPAPALGEEDDDLINAGKQPVTVKPGASFFHHADSFAKNIFVMMELLNKQGESKIVTRCSYPLTGIGCVKRIYTDYAVFCVMPEGLAVLEMAPGLTLGALQAMVGLPLRQV